MKRLLPDLIAIVLFVLLSLAYFFPADIEGRVLFQQDTVAGAGAGQETVAYQQETGVHSRWTGALFSGMPTYQISPSYDSTKVLTFTQKVYRLFLPSNVNLVFIMLLGFYILLRVMGLDSKLSFLGSLMWAFSSYFFILISAGHIWKYLVLAYIPPTIAGMILTFKGKYLYGGLLFALFTALQIQSNHVQMSYYFIMVMLFLFIAFAINAYRKKAWKHLANATLTLLAAGIIGVTMNLSNLYHTYTYSKHTMRAQSELSQVADKSNTSSGLDRDYITQWSYGVDETLTLLVPNFKGGASVPLSGSGRAMEKANPKYGSIYGALTQYYGTQPMTSGPVYVGAFVLALFILGCFIVEGEVKWALLAATILSILLSWGKNFMPLTDFFIDHVPMYNKFRAVSSILVVAEFTIPLLAILATGKILENPKVLLVKKKAVIVSLALTAGIALLIMLFPDAFTSFVPQSEQAMLEGAVKQGGIPQNELSGILASLSQMRESLLVADARRSLLIILAGSIILVLLAYGKIGKTPTAALLVLLTIVDLWSVNKRYLNDEQFIEKDIKENTFAKTQTDELILQDPDPDFRVLNFATSTFNENNTSYYHKSIGGYHAAKMRRYQELIDRYIQPQMSTAYSLIAEAGGDMTEVSKDAFQVLNMLNAKYLIFPVSQDGATVPIQNPYAQGPAWFVDCVSSAQNADEELGRMESIDLSHEAVVDQKFMNLLDGKTTFQTNGESSITLESYKPNQVTYHSHNSYDGMAVFSEIYYPDGWKVTIDGEKAQIGRANYVLRFMAVPQGDHTIIMTFDPDSLKATEAAAYSACAILVLGLITAVILERRKMAKKPS